MTRPVASVRLAPAAARSSLGRYALKAESGAIPSLRHALRRSRSILDERLPVEREDIDDDEDLDDEDAGELRSRFSVFTTPNRFLCFLDSLAIAKSTSSSTFDPAECGVPLLR